MYVFYFFLPISILVQCPLEVFLDAPHLRVSLSPLALVFGEGDVIVINVDGNELMEAHLHVEQFLIALQ